MKKLFLFFNLFLFVFSLSIFAQVDTTKNNSNIDFKGSSLGDPSRNKEDKSIQIDFKGSSLGDPSRGTTSGSLTFTEGYNLKSLSKIEDLNIKWTLKENNSIKKILIVDLTTDDIETIWLVSDYKYNFVNYDKIKSNLLKEFVKEHTYKLNITLYSGENASIDFKYAN